MQTIIRKFTTFFTEQRVCLLLLLPAIFACYFYYASLSNYYGDYYLLLGEAFISGHTYVDVTDPLFDLSYFNGKYYVYFGPVPALVIYVPVKLLTGLSFRDYLMVPFLASVGTLFLSLLFYRIASSQWKVNTWGLAFVILSIGLCTSLPFISHISSVYTAAIAGAYCFSTMGVYFLWLFFCNKHKKYWTIIASLCLGLAVGCRVTYLANIALLLIACYVVLRAPFTKREKFGYVLRLMVPWGICVLSIAIYNYERFGNPIENGIYYMNLNKETDPYKDFVSGAIPMPNRFFFPCMTCTIVNSDIKRFPFGVYYYLFNPLRLGNPTPDPSTGGYAMRNIVPPEYSPNSVMPMWMYMYLGNHGFSDSYRERIYGLLATTPFAWWYLGFLFHRRVRQTWLPSTRNIVSGMEIYSGMILLHLFTYACAQRYLPDFAPWLVSLGGLYYVYLLQWIESRRIRLLLVIIGGIATAYGIFVGMSVGYCAWNDC